MSRVSRSWWQLFLSGRNRVSREVSCETASSRSSCLDGKQGPAGASEGAGPGRGSSRACTPSRGPGAWLPVACARKAQSCLGGGTRNALDHKSGEVSLVRTSQGRGRRWEQSRGEVGSQQRAGRSPVWHRRSVAPPHPQTPCRTEVGRERHGQRVLFTSQATWCRSECAEQQRALG